jgi:uncharacterized membrane protein
MNNNKNLDYINKLVNEENKHIAKLNRIIIESLQEEELLVKRIFKDSKKEKLSLGMKLADKVAIFGGSWLFIILFATIVVVWMVLNNALNNEAFDPYPYILLNLVLSCLAAFQAPVILMSQNRQAEKDRERSEHEYLINLKAELQVRELNNKIDLLITKQMKVLLEVQERELKSLAFIEEKINKLFNNKTIKAPKTRAKS